MAKSKTTKASPEATDAEQSIRSYNRVQLGGRLVADPDLRYTPSGKAVCRLRVATNDTREAQFHDVVAWEDLAETSSEILHKGAEVIVAGRIQTRSWKAADGSARRATEIVASWVSPA